MKIGSGWAVACALLLGVCCGRTSAGPSGSPTFLIRISSLAFSPATLSVPPGAAIVVENDDSAPHSVTSEASPGAFTPGSVGGVSFDTGEFSGPGWQTTFAIPSTAPDGLVIPYYCTVHKGLMTPPDGSITIDVRATAQ